MAARCKPLRPVFEFRNASWFEGANQHETLDFLRAHKLPFVCVDMPQGHKSSVPPVLAATADLAVVRFHGHSDKWTSKDIHEKFGYKYSTDGARGVGAEAARHWPTRPDTTQVFMNNCYADYAQRNAATLHRAALRQRQRRDATATRRDATATATSQGRRPGLPWAAAIASASITAAPPGSLLKKTNPSGSAGRAAPTTSSAPTGRTGATVGPGPRATADSRTRPWSRAASPAGRCRSAQHSAAPRRSSSCRQSSVNQVGAAARPPPVRVPGKLREGRVERVEVGAQGRRQLEQHRTELVAERLGASGTAPTGSAGSLSRLTWVR